ncbi:uncharacterized protein LOC132885939 [Neoarius graeffei]|uniref:uncharacterized protein LOC132885939 n=1 Tax=Neoarius graeffei TaxID=443677 RepID=UPI00298C3FDA|nr:uncharacterized protein LOC132885939 [Neoarius graeffei]XP_060776453.1 uncharacterized protein LOC132885939 [Neoarius graeffei]XP_060776454.1 uncharacterized protein LOC132885939 [Neoarius graeffei]
MTSQTETSLCFVTWNIRGIKKPRKLSRLLETLRKLQADIVFLQETHVGLEYDLQKKVEDETEKTWTVFYTVHSPASKGVAILIKNTIPFEYKRHDEDCSGGYIVLFCHLHGEMFTLVNVYNHQHDRIVLGRLKEYLMETAEGVLVVGGDFNTVLHPCFDRRPSAFNPYNSPLKRVLEDFTVSLNLRDTWSYLHAADVGFTRRQGASQSRIDMFFMHNDIVGRVRSITVEQYKLSDHNPLLLEVEVQQQNRTATGNKFPRVSKKNYTFQYPRHPDDRIPGKISGAEILSVIKSLPDSQEERPDQRQVGYYKRRQWQMTETLKTKYNDMLRTNSVSEAFKESRLSKDRFVFNVEYLIFSQILAKRLSAYIFPYNKKKQEKNLDKFLTVTFKKGTQKIKWSFLEKSLEPEEGLKRKLIGSAPRAKFHILKHLLPTDQGSSGELGLLLPGCPLTRTLLNLALNKLDWILNSEKECRSSVCFQRQALLIHAYQKKQKKQKVARLVEDFEGYSGLKFEKNFA